MAQPTDHPKPASEALRVNMQYEEKKIEHPPNSVVTRCLNQ